MASPSQTRRRRALLTLIGLGLACLVLPRPVQEALKSGVLTVLAPVLAPLHRASEASRRWLGRTLDLGPDPQLEEQLRSLQAVLVTREQETLSLRRQLRGTAELKEHLRGFRAVTAQVIGPDALRWRRSLILDKGQLDGIRNGLVVVCGGRLVGRVVSVGREACRVQCVTDADCRVWVLIGKGDPSRPDGGRVQGVVQGGGDQGLSLMHCTHPEALAAGDPVLTAGYDDRYPPGLLVGQVVNETAVRPACEVEAVEELQVLIPAGESP